MGLTGTLISRVLTTQGEIQKDSRLLTDKKKIRAAGFQFCYIGNNKKPQQTNKKLTNKQKTNNNSKETNDLSKPYKPSLLNDLAPGKPRYPTLQERAGLDQDDTVTLKEHSHFSQAASSPQKGHKKYLCAHTHLMAAARLSLYRIIR